MYEQFGGLVDHDAKTVTFKLFLPDGERAPSQYEGGGLPRIERVFVVGSFQDPAGRQWDIDSPIPMTPAPYHDPRDQLLKGTVYSHTAGPLPDGFYEYKYLVVFKNKERRFITDPCGRYGGTENQNSGFVVGGQTDEVRPLATRLPLKDLFIYELMIDDFTAGIRRADEAPLQTIVRTESTRSNSCRGRPGPIRMIPLTILAGDIIPTRYDYAAIGRGEAGSCRRAAAIQSQPARRWSRAGSASSCSRKASTAATLSSRVG